MQQPQRVDLPGPADLRLNAQQPAAHREADVEGPTAGLDAQSPLAVGDAAVLDAEVRERMRDGIHGQQRMPEIAIFVTQLLVFAPPAGVPEAASRAAFLLEETEMSNTIQTEVETTLASAMPDVEVVLVEVVGGHTVRLFVDHPDGVTLALCEQVTHALPEIRERYALEVSSPGIERPLTKPDHYRRFLGRRARVRTREQLEGHKTFTGELVGASDEEITIAAGTGVIAIPYADIDRSNLVEE